MTKMKLIQLVLLMCMAVFVSASHAATLDWDGDDGDGLLSTAANWDPDQVPATSDTLNISTGATVSHENNLPGSVTINLTGNSSLSTVSAVIRLNNANIDVGSGSSLIGAFWDLDDADLVFEDGAVASMANWEQKDVNTFTFTLGASGFTTLTPGTFRIGNGSLSGDIANATYTADLASYTGSGGVVTLVDFTSDGAAMDNSKFQGAGGLNVINAGSHAARFFWDDAAEAIKLNIDPTVTWDGGGSDGEWKTDDNWTGGPENQAPVANDTVVISNGDTVSYDTSTGQSLPGSLTVNLSGNSTLTASGSAIRLNNAAITVGSGSTLTSTSGTHWDLDDADITFDDGAICTIDDWEQKDDNTFTFILGATGFTTLAPRRFLFRNGSKPWDFANTTYTVDMAAYAGGTGTITLVDFATDDEGRGSDANFQTATLNVLNRGVFTGSNLSWDDTEEAIVLHVMYPTWDGEAGDGEWKTATNWSGDALPIAGSTVTISNGDTVSWDGSTGQNMPGSLTVNLTGNSTLTAVNVLRLNNATITVGSGSALSGSTFWDIGSGDLIFEDGSICTFSDWEQRDNCTFTFELGAAGFAELTPSNFRIGGGSSIANASYTVDMASYAGGTGTITLVDFTNDYATMDNTAFQTATLNVLNRGDFTGSYLSWDDTEEAIVLNVAYPTWDGEAGDGLWTTAENWSGDVLPAAGDPVYITNGDTVEWNETAGSGNLPGSLTVNLSGNSTLTASQVIRLNNATINVASGSGLASVGGTHWDLDNADLTFEDGAVCTVDDWEQRNDNTFSFTLSETGFATLTPNILKSGSGATWADATYNIDMSAYNVINGKTIVLMDFDSHVAAYDGTFNPTVNVTGDGGTLSFDTDESQLIFTVDANMPSVFLFK